ncbi:MAG: PAS domain-containing protein [Rhodoferax sp.]|nr:PAS domain-containing protein [Rhodoferax sp.]MCF8210582.1 PAS domain-containing protein [Rhodoferax sp.]
MMPPSSTAPASSDAPTRASFDAYVVCIGASAGGLDALERFFSACPTDTGAAFVVVQHLSPDHKSIMNTLLSRHTRMPVTMVEEDMPLQANQVYLIPPGSTMHVSPGHLHLRPKKTQGLTLPIDIFFSSLAEVYGEKAVGIILSGTGTDGTRGAVAINAGGGFLMAQEPESCKFDGMPRSAIAAGVMDAVLPPDELPLRLVAHIHNLPYEDQRPVLPVTPHAALTNDDIFAEILQLLYQLGGIDFSDYKPATIMRRLERRMQARHTPELHQYLELLESNREEMLILRREMLISVTSFFRDPEAFEMLADQVIAPLVAATESNATIRVWVAGTATGEEAYSIAMLFLETFDRLKRWPTLKVFATDVDHQAIEKAGMGMYRETITAEISAERLQRFFVYKSGAYHIKSELRQCIVFARQNLLSDPPFTKMDLVLCRNTLIYFKPAAQERVLHALLYALNGGGTLFLGSSESVAMMTEALQVISTKHKLFRRTADRILPLVEHHSKGSSRTRLVPTEVRRKIPVQVAGFNPVDTGITTLLTQYAPPAIIFNETHEAVHLFGDVNPFIQAKQGSASLVVNRLLLDPLVPIASALLYKSIKDQCSLLSDPIQVRLQSGATRSVRLSAHGLKNEGVERLTLLCFETEAFGAQDTRKAVDVSAETMTRIETLERELAATRESLQSTIEELETSNEELQATNEELMASNEELQSSNEELQSVNEELNTVNAEYQEKMLLLNKVNADLESMGKSNGVATVFVDPAMCVTRFSPDVASLFKLRDTDVGRPLTDIAHTMRYPMLMDDLALTLQSGRAVEREVSCTDNDRMLLVRILPYAVASTDGRGAVMSFVDVSAYRDARRLQAILDGLPEHVAVLDSDGTIAMVNNAWKRFAMANGDPDLRATGPGCNYLTACQSDFPEDGHSASAALRGLRGVLEGSLPGFSIEYPCHSPTEERWFVMNVAPIHGPSFGAVVSHINVTSWFKGKAL